MFDDVDEVALELPERFRPRLVGRNLLVLVPGELPGYSRLLQHALVELYLGGSAELVPETGRVTERVTGRLTVGLTGRTDCL